MATKRFHYRPFDLTKRQIRLLRVVKDVHRDGVGVIIWHADLDSEPHPHFHAISYVWGDPTDTRDVTVQYSDADTEARGRLAVTRNLYDFLTTCPNHDLAGKGVWIDQISINQNDIQERGHQVQRMADIFESAEAVMIWLGRSFPGSDNIIRWLAYTREELKERVFYGGDHDKSFADALRQLAMLPYWSRLWTCQEFVLARVLMFRLGDSEATLDSCAMFDTCTTLVLSRQHDWTTEEDDALWRMSRLLEQRHEPTEFQPGRCSSWDVELCALAQDRACHDIRDKVYAVLGLFPEEQRFTPDYRSSPLEILLQMSRAICERSISSYEDSDCHPLFLVHSLENWCQVLGLTPDIDDIRLRTMISEHHNKLQSNFNFDPTNGSLSKRQTNTVHVSHDQQSGK